MPIADDHEDLSTTYLSQLAEDRQEVALDALLAGRSSSAALPSRAPALPDPSSEAGLLERIAGMARTGGGMAAAAGTDVMRGLTGGPGAVAGGIYDAAYHTIGALNDLGNALNTLVPAEVPIEGIPAWLANPLAAMQQAMPSPPAQPSSVTGGIIRAASSFLTGFGPAMRVAGATLPAWLAPSVAGGVTAGTVMDPNTRGVSNLIQSVPSLENPVTEFLATDPNDPAALNRLRQAVEGAGFGLLADAVTKGLRAVALGRQAATAGGKTSIALSPEGEAGMIRDAFLAPPQAPLMTAGKSLRDAERSAMASMGVPDDVVAKGLAGAAEKTRLEAGLRRTLGVPVVSEGGDQTVYVNFARINTTDDIHQVIRDTADAFKDSIVKAQRGTQSSEQTARLAEQLGLSVEQVLARPTSVAWNAEQTYAARMILNTSARELLERAKVAALRRDDEAIQIGFRRALAVHAALQAEVIGARTEAARALRSWAIPVGEGTSVLTANIRDLLERMGGAHTSAEMARKIAMLEGLPPGALATAADRGVMATTWDMVRESYVLGLLWRPDTHAVNFISNLGTMYAQVFERAIAGRISHALGRPDGVASGEALAMAYGQLAAIKNAVRAAWHTLRTGERSVGTKVDAPVGAISSEGVIRSRAMGAIEAEAFRNSGIGRALDVIGAITRFPGRGLEASDELFKTTLYSGEVAAQAVRQATREGRQGTEWFRRVGQLTSRPPEHIRLAATDAARYATFQSEVGNIGRALDHFRSGTFNPVFEILPFVRTPVNLLGYTFERSPFAPMVKAWRDDFFAGGAARDLAIARMAGGSALWAMAADYAMSGYVTGNGPSKPAVRETLMRSGWQPFSFVIDGKYIRYDRADPYAMAWSTAASVADMIKSKELGPAEEEEVRSLLAAAAMAMGSSVLNKTWFTSMANVVQAIEDHGRVGGTKTFEKLMSRQAAAHVPLTTALREVKDVLDPVSRDPHTYWQHIQVQIAGLSQRLAPRMDLWGREIEPQAVFGRPYDILSPARASQWKPEPIDQEMSELGIGHERIRMVTSFNGVPMDFTRHPEVYEYYVKRAGEPALRFLNDMVTGKGPLSIHYAMATDGPEGGKAQLIKRLITDFRHLAAQDILLARQHEFPDFIAGYRRAQREKLGRRAPFPIPGGIPEIPLPQIGGGGITVPGAQP